MKIVRYEDCVCRRECVCALHRGQSSTTKIRAMRQVIKQLREALILMQDEMIAIKKSLHPKANVVSDEWHDALSGCNSALTKADAALAAGRKP